MGKRFVYFCEKYANHFQLKTREVSTQAQQYLCGLMQASRKNMERMAEVVPESDEQALQHFLSNSDWEERSVLDQLALEVDQLIGGYDDTALLLDESGFTKKGKCSVGVARQYNGRLGKNDNCQVGVFAALNRGKRVTVIDKRLYLPTSWTDDPERCEAAGIPKAARTFKTKPELALEMVRYNRRLGMRFQWVGMDGLYGNNPELLRSLDDDGEIFVADVHKNQRIYLEDPKPRIPKRKGNRGRRPTKAVTQSDPVEVANWAKEQEASHWQRKVLRDSTKGQLIVQVLHQEVWLWDGKEEEARRWRLIIRRECADHDEIKYSISNAPASITKHRLAKMQGQRYWIERSFQDGKSEAGMGHYQARGWKSWNHHMALVMMAMLFMLKERMMQTEKTPLLSCSDITTLLAHFLPRRDIQSNEVIRQMEVRHRKRQASIDNAFKNQSLEWSP
jgi:SRSO17 transposase